MQEFIAQQSALSTQHQQQEEALKHELDLLRSRVTALSSTDVKSWLLARRISGQNGRAQTVE